MSLSIIARPLAATLLGPLALPAAGSSPAPPADAYETIVLQSHEFLVYHPDLRFRGLGMQARERGRHEEARNDLVTTKGDTQVWVWSYAKAGALSVSSKSVSAVFQDGVVREVPNIPSSFK